MTASPRIKNLSWGQIVVENNGQDATFKDAKLWPGGARAWDWNETGTSHSPGIQPADVKELIEHGAQTVVLSRGVNKRLQVKEETVDWLKQQNVTIHVLPTKEAAARYNELAKNQQAVGALIHSTC